MKQKSKKEIDEGILNYDFEMENQAFWNHIDIEDELDLDSGDILHCNKWDDWQRKESYKKAADLLQEWFDEGDAEKEKRDYELLMEGEIDLGGKKRRFRK